MTARMLTGTDFHRSAVDQACQNVVAMHYYRGPIGRDAMQTLHVCVDQLDDGRLATMLHTGAALVQPILRARECVRDQLRLRGAACTPAEYIAAWRQEQARMPQASLQAWFAEYEITATIGLPARDTIPARWLSPVYALAARRLFGEHPHGRQTVEIRNANDILDVATVLNALPAFGIPSPSLMSVLQTRPRARQRAAELLETA